ncbi:MAG: proline--tRNA ligase [Desulfuromonadales bacterium]|nr:proline--tRNA ligase [Desulfuromonadales bacterium]MDH4026068.1 proline--tRNA ligase [Desulfuromonadales bacterium]
MRYSHYFLPTLKETPGDAEVVSHQLMSRAGMIRKVAAGIYDYLPLGLKVIRKVENIVREEMNKAGAIEILMPAVCPADLWEQSGRWQQYGKELLRLKDRKETEFCIGPTHEELVTEIVRGTVNSYRQLPVNLYQIQTKFRDEVRPRFGLMRGREFIMKDAYSFDATDEGANASYEKMRKAYCRIFERCGLKYRMVEADSGAIGGSFSHEFMVLADTGEDVVISCESCEYSANIEKAVVIDKGEMSQAPMNEVERVVTKGAHSVADVSVMLDLKPSQIVKTMLVIVDDEPVAVLIRGDHELNEAKVKNLLGASVVELATPEQIAKATGGPVGFSGPIGLKVSLYADNAVKYMRNMGVGGNEKDIHLEGVNLERDFQVKKFADLRNAADGDTCPHCGERYSNTRGIEVGHIFKLGTKYSEAMKATFLDADGVAKEIIMGCYGIGVGRTAAAAIEQNHDENGIIWPMPLAPFQVIVTMLNPNDEEVLAAGEKLYQDLLAEGVEVLLDDRDERPGSKFKDADLLGIPLRVNVGARGLKEQSFELQERRAGERVMLPIEGAAQKVAEQVRAALAAE